MRLADAEFADAAVTPERRVRISHDPLNVFIPHRVIDHLRAARIHHFENRIDLASQRLRLPLHRRDLGNRFAVIRTVCLEAGDGRVRIILLSDRRELRLHFIDNASPRLGIGDAFANGVFTIGKRPTRQA